MKTIAFISQKGGTGKTTLALNIAVEALRQGHLVAVMDLDPQPSAMAWSDMRPHKHDPMVIDVKPPRLQSAAELAARQGLDLLILDTGGRTDEGAYIAAKAADLVVVPIQASAVDLKSMDATRDVLDRAGKPKTMVVQTRVKPFGTRHDETRAWLTANHFMVSPTNIGDRVTFQDAYAAGQTVAEYEPGGKAAQEVKELYMQICKHVGITTNKEGQNGWKAPKSRRVG